tara:strand:- start:31407 stop:31631 length:225 start_codon:yes stop_codon:yes gene_type:complete
MTLTAKELSALAVIAQRRDGVQVNLEQLGLSDEARNLAEILLGVQEADDEDGMIRRLRDWSSDAKRDSAMHVAK